MYTELYQFKTLMTPIIENARPEDAPLIADAILGAVGEEITMRLAGETHTRDDIHDLFARLARREDTQYSYLNTRIAKDKEGVPLGVCISYDGGNLKRLRRPFFAEANATLGWGLTPQEIDDLPGETDSDEFYLDTLMTLPSYRGHGVGEALIRDAAIKAKNSHKPLGLLCDTDNDRARRLYDRVGFTSVGMRPFAGHMMTHMQILEK